MRFIPFLLFFGLLSCQTPNKPVRMDEEKMAAVLADIHIDEATISAMNIVGADSNLLMYNRLERATFKRHQVDSAQFTQSFSSYVQEPKDFIRLYEKVNQYVQQKRKEGAAKK